tara:strand:- start:808 stop:1086 length:279 start_codon:yes stop_codon:yes gene_type:complete
MKVAIFGSRGCCGYKVTVSEDRLEATLEAIRAAGAEDISHLIRHTSEPCDDPVLNDNKKLVPLPRYVAHTWADISFTCTEEIYDRLKDGGTF